ncbi:nitrile hydratase subunit alpha [Bradyrhizobium septentrionale]|nr:nitrile hydratase subunit alpha [Bradyrhizobium septentrionale]UGY22882.1 nitrile hydratase subunit alpha [Bradyrhizobium septentrionale]
MNTQSRPSQVAPVENRVAAIEAVFEQRGMEPKPFIETMTHAAEEEWVPRNGGRVVAKAWTDPAFRQRLFANGKDAVAELGLSMPAHHRHLVALENTETVHNVIVCTLCSCTAFTIIGLPPDWYKDLDYRARGPRVTHGAAGNGPRSAARNRDPRLGYDGRYPLHGDPGPTAGDRRLA